MNKGVCLPGRSTRKALLLRQVLWNGLRSRTYREGTVSTINTQPYATIWCMIMACRCDVVWTNATSIQFELSPFEPRVQMQLQIKLLYMPLYVFTYTAGLGWFLMHENGTDRKIAFFDNFSYINYFNLSYGWISMNFWSFANFLEFPD